MVGDGMRTLRNRENAKSSTGPRSAAGKERSSKNATRHGLAKPSGKAADLFTGSSAVNALEARYADFAQAETEAHILLQKLEAAMAAPESSDDNSDRERAEVEAFLVGLARLERYRTPRLRAWLKICDERLKLGE